jgi:hypothetical protein
MGVAWRRDTDVVLQCCDLPEEVVTHLLELGDPE